MKTEDATTGHEDADPAGRGPLTLTKEDPMNEICPRTKIEPVDDMATGQDHPEIVQVATPGNGQVLSIRSHMDKIATFIFDMEDKITELDSCADVIWRLSNDYPKDSGLALMSCQFCDKIGELHKHWAKIFHITGLYSQGVKIKAPAAGDAEELARTA